MSRKMKDSGVEWIGEIPEKWSVTRVKNRYYSRKKIVGSQLDNYERLALTMKGVIKRNKDDAEGLQPEKFEGYQILKENELVFKLIDLENLATSRVGLSSYTGIVSPAYIILGNRFAAADNRFTYYFFMFMYYQAVFNSLGGDGVRSALNASDVLELPFLEVDDSERCRIANYLDNQVEKIDRLIALQEEIIAELQDYKQSVITEAVTKGLGPGSPTKTTNFAGFSYLPSSWSFRKLSGIASLHNGDRGENYPVEDDYVSEGIPFFNAGNLISGELDVSNSKYITHEKYQRMGGVKIQENDIAFCLRGSIGKNALIQGINNGTVASSLMVIRCHSVLPKYVFYVINSVFFFSQTATYINGTAQPNLSAKNVGNHIIPIPDVDQQEKIVNFLELTTNKVNQAIQLKIQIIKLLHNYKKSLIYECVTGKRDCRAERTEADAGPYGEAV